MNTSGTTTSAITIVPLTTLIGDSAAYIPDKNYDFTDFGNVHYTISSNLDRTESERQFGVLQQFASALVSDSIDLDPDINQIVNKRFWDLI